MIQHAERLEKALAEIAAQGAPCRSPFYRIFEAITLEPDENGEIFRRIELSCKSWRCPRHRENWGRRWANIIAEQLEITPCDLLLNLTTAEATPHEKLAEALAFFMRRFRDAYGPTEYSKIVEFNVAQTQPHLHLLIVNPKLPIPPMPADWPAKLSWPPALFDFVRYLWSEAMSYAAPELNTTKIVWLQPPRSSKKAVFYAVGYITRTPKNEEPPEAWKGRKITFSKHFFSSQTAIIWERLLDRWFPGRQKLKIGLAWQEKEIPLDDAAQVPRLLGWRVRQKLIESNLIQTYGPGHIYEEEFYFDEVEGVMQTIEKLVT